MALPSKIAPPFSHLWERGRSDAPSLRVYFSLKNADRLDPSSVVIVTR
jgi:hypothetical protein